MKETWKMFSHVNWCCGAHTEFSGKICDTLKSAVMSGMYATQFFMGPRMSRAKRAVISEIDLRECEKFLARYPVQVFSHYPYCANLAGQATEDIPAWTGNQLCDSGVLSTIPALEYELGILSQFSSVNNGVVIHPGSLSDRKQGLSSIVKSINKISFPKGSTLLLENSAGQGSSLATTFEEIAYILDNVLETQKPHLKVCVDTCHIFAYGQYDLRAQEEVERMLSEFDAIIGMDKLGLIHLNDSEKKLKSRVDRHACLGQGLIWPENFASLRVLLDTVKVPVVLETTTSDMSTLANLDVLP